LLELAVLLGRSEASKEIEILVLRRRGRGDGHPAALRHLFNRMLGQLNQCLRTRQTYDPAKAFGHAAVSHATDAATAAA
jgi:hypothetical protein